MIFAILLSTTFVCIRTNIMPVLMRNANYGIQSLITKGEVKNLFVGSSMFRQGIDAPALSAEEGDSFLLSYNANQPYFIYHQIEKLLHNDVKIKNLFVDMYAYSLTTSPALSDVRILQDNDLNFVFSIYDTMKENRTADLADLYEMVFKSNNEVFLSWPLSYPLINSRYVYGSNNTKNVGATAEKLKNLPLEFGNKDAHPVQIENLKKIIDLCRENEINIVFLETPKYARLYEGENYCGIMKEYTDILNEQGVKQIISQQTARACGLTDHANYLLYAYDSNNPSYFADLIHLSYDGRKQFTEVFKNIISSLEF